jgi:hypothetical protein
MNKTKFDSKLINANAIEFGPWVPFNSDTFTPISTDEPLPQFGISIKNKNLLPRVNKYLNKDLNK